MEYLVQNNKMVKCDACTDYAKAKLDGRSLCAGCLLRELMSARDASLFERLTPLPNADGAIDRQAPQG